MLFVCVEVVSFLFALHPTSESDVAAVFFVVFSKPEMWAKNAFFIAAGRSRVRSAHSHSFTHPGAVQCCRRHCVLLTDHLHQSLRSVRLRGLCLSEMRKEKIGREKAVAAVCVCVCVHRLSGLTPPHSPTLPSHALPPPLSRSSGRYMCGERQLREQFRARAKGTRTH